MNVSQSRECSIIDIDNDILFYTFLFLVVTSYISNLSTYLCFIFQESAEVDNNWEDTQN